MLQPAAAMLSSRSSGVAAKAQVSEELRSKWRAAFTAFDLNGSGVIDAQELTAVMHSLKMIPHDGEVEAMIAAVDHDGDQAVNFEEFELMMVSSGRDKTSCGKVGFAHVVDRHIKMGDVAKLITSECTSFVDRFCREHVAEYMDLPHPDEKGMEHKPAWFDTYKRFTEEAELTMQTVMVLWGVAAQKSFDEDFLEAIQNGNLLDDFLRLTEYERFINRMRSYVHEQQSGVPVMDPSVMAHIPRPMTPHTRARTQQRLAEIDQELSSLDMKRNRLIAERRRLIGCEVEPITTGCLKHELEARRWREDVGFD